MTVFDANYSSKQDVLAHREKMGRGGAATEKTQMTKEQASRMANSKYAQMSRQIEETVKDTMDKRMKQMMALDINWIPNDADFEAPKAFIYDKHIDYYGVLGIPNTATQEEVKNAYKKLSLIYHPDKTSGMSEEDQAKHKAIFIELKNAYTTLLDYPTRRQYDTDRVKEIVQCEFQGTKMKKKQQFWGYETREQQKMQTFERSQPQSSAIIDVPIKCSLEKFVYGGHKAIHRKRRARIKGEWQNIDKVYRLDIQAGAKEPLDICFAKKGDEHEHALPDTLKFQIQSKPHDLIERVNEHDIKMKKTTQVHMDLHAEPYFACETPSVRGRHLIIWGRNPFYRVSKRPSAQLDMEVLGQGAGKQGSLFVSAVLDSTAPPATSSTDVGTAATKDQKTKAGVDLTFIGKVWEVVGGQAQGGILVRQGSDTSSAKEPQRLSTLALVKQLEVQGDRLQYELLEGNGPRTGWVSIKLQSKDLLEEVGKVWEVVGGGDKGVPARKAKAATSADAGVLKKGSLVKQLAIDGDNIRFEKVAGTGPANGWVNVGKEVEAPKPKTKVVAVPKDSLGAEDKDTPKHPGLAKRWQKLRNQDLACEVQLAPASGPIPLATKPSCTMTLYSNLHQSAQPKDGKVKPRALFAVVITSAACNKKKMASEWHTLKEGLLPPLRASAYLLFRAVRGILARPLANYPAAPLQDQTAASGSMVNAYEQLGDSAGRRQDYWLASLYYLKALEVQTVSDKDSARLLTNRAACLSEVQDFAGSVAEASRAVELAPEWSRPWSILGHARMKAADSDAAVSEAIEELAKAVELEPISENVSALQEAAAQQSFAFGVSNALKEKYKGNDAFKHNRFSHAIVSYTLALARLPPVSGTHDPLAKAGKPDDRALLEIALFSNRSAAFAQLHKWSDAVADAQHAAGIHTKSSKALCRLGVAHLGHRHVEKAYEAFAKALNVQDDHVTAWQGCSAAMTEMIYWRSLPAQSRRSRFFHDIRRPKGSTRVFAIADLRLDHKKNQDWAVMIDDKKFQDDVLIVAGGVADSMERIVKGLAVLRGKFRRIFYSFGCQELWIPPQEKDIFPDSLAKMNSLFGACDELDIDVGPACVCEDVFVVPLLSWFHNDFVEDDRDLAGREVNFEPYCKWPIDRDEIWRYMLKMNEPNLKQPYHSTVLTFSHCLPRVDLPYVGRSHRMGTRELDDQLRSVKSKLHFFSRSDRRYAKNHDGVMYANMPILLPDEWMEEAPPLMCIYDGQSTCAEEWGINGVKVVEPALPRLMAPFKISTFGR